MALDLDAALRRRKPEKRLTPLAIRPADNRLLASAIQGRLAAILPDSCVYIDAASGRLPDAARLLLNGATQHHSAVCLGEIAVGLGHMSPGARGYRAARNHYSALMATIPPRRLVSPQPEDWLDAGLLAGTLARLQGLPAQQRKALYNDALIYVTATKSGLPVLTADRGFDLLQQLHPAGAVIFY